jgi:hypothetical protein
LSVSLYHSQSGIQIDPLSGHTFQKPVGNLVTPGAVLHRGGADLHGVGDIARVAGVDRQRQMLHASLFGNGARQQQVQAIEEHALAPSLQNGLDAVHSRSLQTAHLPARLLRRFRNAHDLRLDRVLDGTGKAFQELGAVPALGRKHRAADEELRTQFAAGSDPLAELERRIQTIAHAARRGHAAVEQCSGRVRQGLLRIVVRGRRGYAARRREMTTGRNGRCGNG